MGFYTANYRSTNSFIQIAMRDLSITNSFSYVEVVLWILPIVGGIVADRWVGRRAMILIGHAFRIISLFFILIAAIGVYHSGYLERDMLDRSEALTLSPLSNWCTVIGYLFMYPSMLSMASNVVFFFDQINAARNRKDLMGGQRINTP